MSFNRFYPAKKYKWTTYNLKFLKEMLIRRRDNEKDNIILVTGARGEGKSTLTGKILFQFPEFDPFESIIYSKEAMFKLIKKKKGFVWADESVISAAKGNVMTRANKLLFEVFTINRDNFNIVFLLMPFVEDFDTKILQYVSAWIHVDSRGLGVLLLPSNKGLFGKRNWDLNSMKKIFDEFQKENQNAYHAPYWIFDNFRGYVRFSKLTPQQDAIIKEIKQLRKNENMDKEMQEDVKVEVKSLENYSKYSAKKLSEMIVKGEIRCIEQFNQTCKDMKLNEVEMINKCGAIFRKSGIGQTPRGMLKDYDVQDSKIKF